jgi:DNA-binding transcriptional regulator WhiA
MENLDTGNIRHTIHRTNREINTTQHRMVNLDTGNIRHTRHRTRTNINTIQHRE